MRICAAPSAPRVPTSNTPQSRCTSPTSKLQSIFDTDTYAFLGDVDAVKQKVSHLHYTTQRNHFNAIIVLLMALGDDENKALTQQYSTMRDEFNAKYVEDQQSGTISDKQAGNFATIDEIKGMVAKMKSEIAFHQLKKKESLTSKDKELLQVYVIFNILLSIPLRNDLSGMRSTTTREFNKIPMEEREHTNYLVVEKNSMKFVLNEYKTSRKCKEKVIQIPKDLQRIMRMYLKIQGDGILFTSPTGKVLSRNALSRLLTKTSTQYLGKAVGSTMMRKIVASDLLKDVKKMEEELSHKMGTDISTIKAILLRRPHDEINVYAAL